MKNCAYKAFVGARNDIEERKTDSISKGTFVVVNTKTSSVDGHADSFDNAKALAQDRCKNGNPHEVCKVIARYKQSDEIIEEAL
jgi:hypothetical protein